jgi:hypothetical protein
MYCHLQLFLLIGSCLLAYIPNAAVYSQSTWQGCVIQGTSPVVRKGQKTPVCIIISSGDDWGTVQIPYARYLWTPVADQMSVFTLSQSYLDLVKTPSSSLAQSFLPFVSLSVQSNTTLSFIRRWYDQQRLLLFPYLTAIINVHKGIIQGISWDDACVFCSAGSTRCMEDTFYYNGTAATQISEPTTGCWYSKSECDKIYNTNGTLCNVKVYAVWSGTDANGVALTSFNSRFSAFPSDQVTNALRDYSQDYINAGITAVTDAAGTVSTAVSNATNSVTGSTGREI